MVSVEKPHSEIFDFGQFPNGCWKVNDGIVNSLGMYNHLFKCVKSGAEPLSISKLLGRDNR